MPALPTTTGDATTPAQWTYSPPGDPLFGDVDVVRLYLQDTDPAMPLLPDVEIQWLIDQWMPRHDSLIFVASVAAERISHKFAGVLTVTADGVSVDVGSLSERYRQVAADLRQSHKDGQVGGEVDIANLMASQQPDYGIDPLSFGLGMHDNREAGQQDYEGYGRNHTGPYAADTVRPG